MADPRPSSEFVRRSCPLCGQDAATPLLKKGALHLVRCRNCLMTYANPVEAELASGAYYDRISLPFYLSPDKLQSDYAPVRFERELRLFRAYCRSGPVLDVGCSTGAFLFQLKARFPADYRLAGMDVAGAALDHAESRGIEAIRASFPDGDYGSRHFEAITFWAVLEHVVQPGRFLSQAAAILRPGGYCFILVPNMNSLASRILGAKYRYIMPDHLNYFTAETLTGLAATQPAFERVRLSQSHFNPLVILKDLRSRTEPVPREERARLLRRTTALKQHSLLRPVKWIYAGVERTLAAMGLADNLVMVLRRKST
jgi:SAM-dependent methyltransferase